jgi:malate synthase
MKIKYYEDFLSPTILSYLQRAATPVQEVEDLYQIGDTAGLENKESLSFLCELYQILKPELDIILKRRQKDRHFIDSRTKALVQFNQEYKRDFLSPDYKTIFGLTDGDGRIVMGPFHDGYAASGGNKISEIPDWFKGEHVTLFGPPDNAKLSINAMNAYHRKLPGEPAIVGDLLEKSDILPKWGADDEDSKTPLREDLISAGVNLTGCLEGTLEFEDSKKYSLAKEKLALPIKRFPGLALPSLFLFFKGEPLPLHLYDFVMHFFKNYKNKKALAFYVPKLENEEEARYIKLMLETAERMIQKIDPQYEMYSIRLMIVLENPRAIFRTHEIMDALYPYFMGASLGWHDFLASTARLFKEDPNYRIPVKADPNIVIKYIKASHSLLSEVVGGRGGIKVGGMYGILPIDNNIKSESFQMTLKGYIKDVITQMKRNLSGFWVAHPDFVRLGIAFIEAWKIHKNGDSSKLEKMIKDLLDEKYHKEILDFIYGPDIKGLDRNDPLYARSLIVADMKESTYIANNHPEEIRYNVFQSLQYITDWLTGNGCVALPAQVGGVSVRVMDDLATAERSRWEVWHEIYHQRFSVEEFIKIAHEEFHFIRKDLSHKDKIVQVKWDQRTSKWYPIALKLMIKLMTDKNPVEFATELFLPFTIEDVRRANDPWERILKIDYKKYQLDEYTERLHYYFERCGCLKFAIPMSKGIVIDFKQAERLILDFKKEDVLEAALFHGDIGSGKATLDQMATIEQKRVFESNQQTQSELQSLGKKYREKFGVKFLVSAKDKTGEELLEMLKRRLELPESEELLNAKKELFLITKKRLIAEPLNLLHLKMDEILNKHKIDSAQISILHHHHVQNVCLGHADLKTKFELASLSKTIASAFAIEFFHSLNIPLSSSVNELLRKTKSTFQIDNGQDVRIEHLMNHSALNMHYVYGLPSTKKMPKVENLLMKNNEFNYEPIKVLHPPGEVFKYSGGGFLVLEHLIEALSGKSIQELTKKFLMELGLKNLTFNQETQPDYKYATGFNDQGIKAEEVRLMFPAFAAGALGTSADMLSFLKSLGDAYESLDGDLGISHDTAVMMLSGQDKGCMNFMGTLMGLGVFIGLAGENKLMIHQGANDGFRCLYLYCFSGLDKGKGFVLLVNSDFKGVLFNAEIAQEILKTLNFSGIDFSKFKTTFNVEKIPPEEMVNMGYKNLIFNAFIYPQPEEIVSKGLKDPWAEFNLVVDAKVLKVSNEKFARAENLVSPFLPVFDPELFGSQGKIMDSWETVRHNPLGVDTLIIELNKPSTFLYVYFSTQFHFGNHAPVVSLAGFDGKNWIEFLPKTTLHGHSQKKIKLSFKTPVFYQVKVSIYPDGGLTRLGLFDESFPYGKMFKHQSEAADEPFIEKIPMTKKPLTLSYDYDDKEKELNSSIKKQPVVNIASSALGAKIVSASNEHYSPAVQVISPFPPLHMFDGMESARSREENHFEEVIIELAKESQLSKIDLSFDYFVNNNPLFVSIEGLTKNGWITLAEKSKVKPFAGNKKRFNINDKNHYSQIKVKTYPDGGINRIKVYSK